MKSVGFCLNILFLAFAVSGCSSQAFKEVAGNALEQVASDQTELGYSPQQCQIVKTQCEFGFYEEWPTSDGQKGCSCRR